MYDLTEENLSLCEKNVLKLTDMNPDEIEQRNVYVAEDVYIRTNIFGKDDKPILVLIHGYAASGPLFFKIIKKMCQYFTFITLDIPGMGGSSRPDNFDKRFTPEQSN